MGANRRPGPLADILKIRFCVRTIAAHDDWVRYVVPSDDDRLLASCSNDHVRT